MAQERWIAPASFMLLITAYHLIFGQFFPTKYGTLGHDYSRILPDLLDGYFWFKNNGLFEPFWFTPSFCGGQPALGAPESGYYSVAQLLTFFATPLTSIYTTVLLFSALGFWGFYLLLRGCFNSSIQAAVLGGALFMFNGFFIHRMLIGHFTFHGVMLIPLVAYLLLRPIEKNYLNTLFCCIFAGIMLAYCTYSGMVHLLLPFVLSVLGIASIQGFLRIECNNLFYRLLLAGLVAAGLSAAKLSAALLFLQNFPRSDYLLPGITNFWPTIYLLFNELFFAPTDIAEQALSQLAGVQWYLNRHEWEYGITLVPLLIILTGTACVLARKRETHLQSSSAGWAWLALLGFVLALPIALNYYTPLWNSLLKQVPLIKSSSNLLRWFLIFIPIVILVAALLMDKISHRVKIRNYILVAALAVLILINATKDRTYYQSQPYRPDTIVNAWQSASTNNTPAQIRNIGAFLGVNNQILVAGNRNDLIASGTSQIVCYNPIFGYQLEHFPIKSLHLGPALAEMDGLLNIKNPACYLYPEYNNCTPGDHFIDKQIEAAHAFANYKPFSFNIPTIQFIANWLTKLTLIFIALLFTFMLAKIIARSVKAK